MKIRIVETVSPDDSFIDADEGWLHSEERQLSEPIRLFPGPTSAPPVASDDDAPLPYDGQLPALQTALAYKGMDRIKSKTVASILGVDEDTARSLIDKGNDYVLNWRLERRRAERRAAFEERHAKWEAAEAKRLASLAFWIFRNKLVEVEGWEAASRAEVVAHVKHKVLSEEDNFKKMCREIQLFENLEKASPMREPIPRDIQMYVWRRDNGRCVQCGCKERLEYDHVIPLALGGSNTERNIQLLCETCNRKKGAAI